MTKLSRFVLAIAILLCLGTISSTSTRIGQEPVLLAWCQAMGGYPSFEAQARAEAAAQARADRANAKRIRAEQRIQTKSDQTALKQLGYYNGSVDGISGSGTRIAIKEFQAMNGLTVNGSMSKYSRTLIAEGRAKNKNAIKHAETVSDQTALQQLGYYQGRIDGKQSPVVREAIKKFQQTNGLEVNGSMSKYSRTLIAEGKAKNIYNVTKIRVKSDQTLLKKLGYYQGTIDGIQSPATREAIKKFQAMNGLKVNGSMSQWSRKLITDGKAKNSNGR